MVVADPLLLAEALRARYDGGTLLVGIEGASGAGKTYLAGRLGAALGAQIVKTDAYYESGTLGERYQDGLRITDLGSELDHLLASGGIFIVEGLCLRETLSLVQVAADVVVYAKRVSSAGVWHDDPDLTASLQRESSFAQGRIDWWSHDYHVRHNPHGRADFVFEWCEG